MALPIFVYGTLKRSTKRSPHALMRKAQFVDVASMSGILYDLGRYRGAYRESPLAIASSVSCTLFRRRPLTARSRRWTDTRVRSLPGSECM